jgi:hypothetical protein
VFSSREVAELAGQAYEVANRDWGYEIYERKLDNV